MHKVKVQLPHHAEISEMKINWTIRFNVYKLLGSAHF